MSGMAAFKLVEGALIVGVLVLLWRSANRVGRSRAETKDDESG